MSDFFSSLFGDTSLEADRCLKLNAAIGGLALLSAAFVAVFAIVKPPMPFPIWLPIVQLGFGLAYVAGMPIAQARPIFKDRIIWAQGFVLLALIFMYTAFAVIICTTLITSHIRIAHPPGLLAIGMAYAFRQITDFGGSSRYARSATWAGVVVGALCDIVVIGLLFWMIVRTALNPFDVL